jgi:hypothetical protein
VAKGKAATETALVRSLTPEQREAEDAASKAASKSRNARRVLARLKGSRRTKTPDYRVGAIWIRLMSQRVRLVNAAWRGWMGSGFLRFGQTTLSRAGDDQSCVRCLTHLIFYPGAQTRRSAP